MYNNLSITAYNINVTYWAKLWGMHPTMRRVYLAAKELRGIETQSDLARTLGVSSQVIYNWEERGMSQAGMVNAEAKIGCRAAWIQDGRGSMVGGEIRSKNGTPSGIVRVPLLPWGSVVNLTEAAIKSAENWIPAPENVSPKSFALTIQNDSMSPEFNEGDIIVIDPARDPAPGAFVIIKLDETGYTFRQLIVDAGKRFLKPLNPRYPLSEMPESSVVVGVVSFKTKAY